MYRNMKNKIYSGEYGFVNGRLRKAAVLFVSLIMLMSLVACGSNSADGPTSVTYAGKLGGESADHSAGDGKASGKGADKKSKPVYDGFGEMLFTHFGVSGPLVLTASCFYEKDKPAHLLLDLKPALSEEQLDKRVLRDFEEGLNKQFKNILGGLFPSKLIPVMIKLSGIDPEKTVNEITREERLSFVKLIKNVPMTVTGTRNFNEAIITRGGVSVKEVNPSTMESKLVKGLFFAGEVLDLDAETGGFNLQIAWSTGHLAGECAAE